MQQSNLNLIPSGDMPIIYASQYDNNRVIRFNLFDGEDEYTLSGTETVKCNIRKNDEHIVVIVPTIGANKYIDVYLTEQACACFGDNIGEITISSGEDNIIGTINFILKVERNPIQGGVTSASDIADLESQIEDIVHEVMTDDYYTRDEVDAKLDLKANASDVYTKSQVDTALGLKADKADTYTKSQVDTALASKADASSVYTKSEVDTALALKANASDVYTKTEVDEIIDDLYPVNTASGSIATFTTSLVRPLTELTSTIVAQQASGTPTPSSPLPISGFSSVNVTRTGKNLLNMDKYCSDNNISYTTSNGIYYFNANLAMYNNPFVVSNVDVPITLQIKSLSGNATKIRFEIMNVNNEVVASTGTSQSLIISGTGSKIRFNYSMGGSVIVDNPICYLAGSADTFTLPLGQTVYGGYVDWKNGKLVVTHDIIDLGTLTPYQRTAPNEHQFAFHVLTPTSSKLVACTSYKCVKTALANLGNYEITTADTIGTYYPVILRNDDYNNAADLKESLDGVYLVYELATPVEIDITANNFMTINGEQNIFSDCGEVTVGFKQGIQEYIDSKIGG